MELYLTVESPRTTQHRHLSITKYLKQDFASEKKMATVPRPDEWCIKKLNDMVKLRPFSAYHKTRKYDPL